MFPATPSPEKKSDVAAKLWKEKLEEFGLERKRA